tara:strand:+ start:2647 stop:3579 length:933 start_codon:yes stop_codon:yes gene_type:complete
MSDNKRTFTVQGKEYAVLRPTAKQTEDATMEYNRVFSRCLQNGALLRERLDHFMRQQNLWDDERQDQYDELLKQINSREQKLSKGGIKLSEAKDAALEMRTLRATLQALIAQRNSLDVNTAQGQAENARFNYLLVACLVYSDNGETVYESIQDYSDKQANGDPVGPVGAEHFGNLYFGLEKDYEKKLPENKFLKEYEFVDDDLRLINEDGHLIDWQGKLIDEEGRYVDEEGNLVDFEGNPLSDDGKYNFEFSPFLDDNGEPLKNESEETEESAEEEDSEQEAAKEKPLQQKKKRGRPKKVEEKAETVDKS